MAYLELPVRSDLPAYRFTTTLEGEKFGFQFHYNKRYDRWLFNLLDVNNNQLLSGIPLLTGLDLLGRYKYENLPLGTFLVLDETGQNRDPGEVGLGDDFKLIYRESTTND